MKIRSNKAGYTRPCKQSPACNSNKAKPGKAYAQRGVGLIEILISVVILSIGFLAAARMQIEGMRSSQGSYFQSQAYFMANEIIDRMRANIDGVRDGYYSQSFTTDSGASNPDCNTNDCDKEQLAEQDLYDWSSHLHPATSDMAPVLPSGETYAASGAINSLGDGRFSVTMTWSEIVNGEENQQTLSLNFITEI
ncbi:MAG: type IV pilus modification protein PilV [Granulosicoccus sp.]